MREYVAILRAILAASRRRPARSGRRASRSAGSAPTRTSDLRRGAVAGDAAPGRRGRRRRMLWLCNPEYIREVVMPEVSAGRERAGKTLEGFEVVAAVPSALVDDPGRPTRRCAATCCPTSACPSTARCSSARASSDGHRGLRRGRRARRRRGDAGGDLRALPARAVRDRLAEDVRAGVARYRTPGATAPCVGPIARTDFEATLRAAAPG